MKDYIKRIANAYFSIMLLMAAMGLIALLLGVFAYLTGLTAKPDSTIQLNNILGAILFYPAAFIILSLFSAFLSRPKGKDKTEYRFFDAIKALFRISKNADISGGESLSGRYLSVMICLLLMVFALMSYLCFYIFVSTVIIKIYNAIWQLVIVTGIIALIIAIRFIVIKMKLKRIQNKKA